MLIVPKRAQAAEIDKLCGDAWRRHSRYVFISNEGYGWPAKAQAAREVLAEWMAIHYE